MGTDDYHNAHTGGGGFMFNGSVLQNALRDQMPPPPAAGYDEEYDGQVSFPPIDASPHQSPKEMRDEGKALGEPGRRREPSPPPITNFRHRHLTTDHRRRRRRR